MAIIKCKMCGGDLVLIDGQSVAECEYCGSRQTVPVADNEKKLNLFASANKLRAACEFDRAAGVYDAIKAEFPSEAEAYWGLVLCKYGIEYVDDPATGQKVPTCHRLSYDSVMDDGNLEMAMDCADSVARKVYREEAKHLEQIRTGILEVSANEKPYDIFICYKETDENGDRTLDSVLAQDLYSALTDKGYRVFFSRITLQSKLGEAYEPYIFAALNSAKVMLAVGTDPDYYSAVWVKNEWSRYLKICAEDKSKHLIPCYKGLDAYDLPREFRPLQGVDLGKMGAVQDILFNMEKYIPLKKQTTTVIREKVVVGGTGGSNKIASLLDRGNMALEDGDWAKADSFFEDVLNNDSKNAQAYIGKTLAQERCRTMDALVRKRKDVYQNVSSEKLYIGEKATHISQMVERYSLSGYVEQTSIRGLYRFDLSYTSEVSGRQKQYHEEEIWWQNHKQLSRAEKFAMGAVAEHLQSEKKHLFAQLADRAKKAQESDARAVAKLEAAYDAHIVEADKRAEKLYNDGLTRRERDYENWLEQAKKENNPVQLNKLADNFASLREYKDSKNLAEHCRKRAADEEAKIDTENERQRVIAEQKRKAQQKRKKTIAVIATACVVLAVAMALVITKVIIPRNVYEEAISLMENGQYEESMTSFAALGTYKDSAERMEVCKAIVEKAEAERRTAEQIEKDYQYAISVLSYGVGVDYAKISEAHDIFERLGDYKNSQTYLSQFTKRHIQTTRVPNEEDYPKNIWYDEYGRKFDEGYVYDEQGRLVRDGEIVNEYNDDGQLIKSDDGHSFVLECLYDSQGNKSGQKTTLITEDGDPWIYYVEYQYENGLVMKETQYTSNELYGDNSLYSSQSYKYDSKGNVIESTITYHQTKGNYAATAYYRYTYNEDGSRNQSEYKRGKDAHIDTCVYDWVWAPKHS